MAVILKHLVFTCLLCAAISSGENFVAKKSINIFNGENQLQQQIKVLENPEVEGSQALNVHNRKPIIPECPLWPFWPFCHRTSTSTENPSEPTKEPTEEPTKEPTTVTETDEPPIVSLSSSTTEKPGHANDYEWIEKNPGKIPGGCAFVYGGVALNRLLYAGRVQINGHVVPAAIHHYGGAGTETYTAFVNGNISRGNGTIEWLCAGSGVAWVRVSDLSKSVIESSNAIPVGWNSDTNEPIYACISHSFYMDQYPSSIGQVVDNACQFIVNDQVVSTADFKWWHTLELLASL